MRWAPFLLARQDLAHNGRVPTTENERVKQSIRENPSRLAGTGAIDSESDVHLLPPFPGPAGRIADADQQNAE